MFKNRLPFETVNHGNVADNNFNKTMYKLESRPISRDSSHYSRIELRLLQSPQIENKIQDQAVPERCFSDINRLHNFAQIVAIQLLETCFTLPFIHDFMTLSASKKVPTSTSRLMSFTMNQPMIILLQMHPERSYRTDFSENLASIRLGYGLYDGTSSDDYSFQQTSSSQEKYFSDYPIVSKKRRQKSKSMSQALFVTQGIPSNNELIAPQSFHQDFRLSYRPKALCKAVTGRMYGYSRGKNSNFQSLSLSEKVSMEDVVRVGHGSLEKKILKVKKTLMKKRRCRDVKSANDVALTHRYNLVDVGISSADFRSNETSPTKSLIKVSQPKSSEIPSMNASVDLTALDDGLNHYAKSPTAIIKASEISAKKFLLPSMALPHKKSNRKRKDKYPESMVSEVSPSDHRLYEISDPWQRNALSVYGSALGSPIGYSMSPNRSPSPPLFFKREDRMSSTSQVSVPDDFSANVVHYGERRILSLLGSSCSSSKSAFPSPFAKICRKKMRSDTSRSAPEENLSHEQNQIYPTIEIESLTVSKISESIRLGTKNYGFETGRKLNIPTRSGRRKEMTIF
ncbi:hypothetical protein Golomagni_03092 [Golovinomyces magnicellulatus]|nr:hypothetical protein Golomagni_03092 [Golovinomyces magnicellulatus]